VRPLRRSLARVARLGSRGLAAKKRDDSGPVRADEGARLLDELKRQGTTLFGGILPIGAESALQLLALQSRVAGDEHEPAGSARVLEMLLRLSEGVGIRSGYARALRGAVIAFTARGFDDARIEDILAAGEVSPRTFYQFFGSKHEALAALSDLFLTVVVEVTRRELAQPGTNEERLRKLSRILVGGVALLERMAQIVISEALRPGSPLESLYERFRGELGAIAAPLYGPPGDAAALMQARVRLIAAMGATLELRLGRLSTPDQLRAGEELVHEILLPSADRAR
jgi:AcrR family transcriptional regulator